MNDAIKNWIPVRLQFDSDTVLAHWQYFDDLLFDEPFFESTIQKSLILSENAHGFQPVTSLETLSEAAQSVDSIPPTAFIFHVSRCGSTLMTQMLALDTDNIVVSEAPVLDDALREMAFKIKENYEKNLQYSLRFIGKKISGNDSIQNLGLQRDELDEAVINQTIQSVVALMGQKRIGNEKNYFIKLDSWHIFYYEKLRKLYPNTPFIFSYRRPDEVIRSQMQLNGMHAVPGLIQLEVFGLELFEVMNLQQADFVGKVLEKYFEKFLKIVESDTNVLFVDYKDGIMTNMSKLGDFLGLHFDDDYQEKMRLRSQFHSKNPNTTFSEKPLEENPPLPQEKVFGLYKKLCDSLN